MALLGGCWLVALSTWPAPAAEAMPRGEVRVGVERQIMRWGPYGSAGSWDGLMTSFGGQLAPDNRGVWSFGVERSERGGSGFVNADDVPTRLGRLKLRAGDFSLGGDTFRARMGEFRPSIGVRGGSLGLRGWSFLFETRAGNLTERRGVTGRTVEATEARLLGFGVSGPLGGGHRWRLAWDRQSTGSDSPNGFEVAGIELASDALAHWTWLGDFRASWDASEGAGASSALAGLTYTGERVVLTGQARRIERGFHGLGLNRDPHENEWGGRFEASLRPVSAFLLAGALDWARDLSRRSDGYPPEERTVARVSIAAPLVRPFYTQGSAAYRKRSTVDPDSLLVDQGTFYGNGEIGWRAAGHAGSIGYTRGIFRDPTRETGDWHEDRWTARFSRRLTRAYRAELAAARVERRLPDGTWTSRERRLESRLEWDPDGRRRLWLGVARGRQEAGDAAFAHDQWELGGGVQVPIVVDLMIEFEGYANLRAGTGRADASHVSLGLSRTFSFGGGRLAAGESPDEFASVSGFAFEDLNENGRRDRGEPGIAGQMLRLGSGGEAATAPDGAYRLERAAAGLEYLSFDPARLPARYLAPAETRIPLKLRAGENALVQFPIRRAAAVTGRVAIRDEKGELVGMPGVLIAVRGGHQDVFTGPDGGFTIGDLPSGPVVIELKEWSLPEWAQVSGSPERETVLVSGRTTPLASFALVRVDPEVRQHYRRKPR